MKLNRLNNYNKNNSNNNDDNSINFWQFMLFVKRKNCAQNLEYRKRPQVEGGNQDRQMLVKTEVLQFKERGFTELFLCNI